MLRFVEYLRASPSSSCSGERTPVMVFFSEQLKNNVPGSNSMYDHANHRTDDLVVRTYQRRRGMNQYPQRAWEDFAGLAFALSARMCAEARPRPDFKLGSHTTDLCLRKRPEPLGAGNDEDPNDEIQKRMRDRCLNH